MSYKIHRENTKRFPGMHIVPESESLFTVATREEVEEVWRCLAKQGITDVYVVGFDPPSVEPLDAWAQGH
jgi:hypothetical protein